MVLSAIQHLLDRELTIPRMEREVLPNHQSKKGNRMNLEQKDLMKYLADRLVDLEQIQSLPDKPTNTPEFNLVEWYQKTECGTAVCAMGFAAMDPKFQALGLKLNNESTCYVRGLVFKNKRNWPAVALLFGINEFEAQYLFSHECYRIDYATPADVAARLNNFARWRDI